MSAESDVVMVDEDDRWTTNKDGKHLRVLSYSVSKRRLACAIDIHNGFKPLYPTFSDVGEEGLKEAEIWDILPSDIQAEISKRDKAEELGMVKTSGRRGRKPNPAHAGLPKKLKCSVCEELKGTTPERFLKQVAKSGKTQQDFIDTYVCRSCRKKEREGNE